MNIKKTALAVAMMTALGVPTTASAIKFFVTFEGLLTLTDSSGTAIINSDGIGQPPWYGGRTPVIGTLTFNADAGTGSGEILPFSFFGQGHASATNIAISFIGNGMGGYGNLSLVNMSFNWNNNNGIPVNLIWDNTGLFAAAGDGYDLGEIVTGGVLSETDDLLFGSPRSSYRLPIGPVPIAATNFNTTTIGSPCDLGCNPSGTLPLSDDGISGSPMPAGPFPGFNANFDIVKLRFTTFPPPPEFVDIEIPGGDTQECTSTGGRELAMNTNIMLLDTDVVDTVFWSLDGAPAASGESAVVQVSLGSHTVGVNVMTVLGSSLSDTVTVTVQDTVAPLIDVAFVDSKTRAEITSIGSKGKAQISIEVSDVCDASPRSSANAGLPVLDGDKIKTKGSKGSKGSKSNAVAELSIKGNADNVEVMVTAEDESGNMSSSKATLIVIQ